MRISALVLILAMHVMSALAGTTGKIMGQVVDKETNEPLAGVNVVIVTTMLGAVTDVYGNFSILNVPPGTYQVKVMLIGYGVVIINDAHVTIDQTTWLNASLFSEAVQIGEQIIEAPRDVLRKDVSTSVTSFTSSEVEQLPVVNVIEVAGMQAGVQNAGSNLYTIRGGGADESLFLVDGVTMRDPRTNQPITGVPMSSIKEMTIERGGFSAEYGQLRSGIINVVSKEGEVNHYNATLTARYKPYAPKYFGTSPYDQGSYHMRPYLDPAVCWTGTDNGAWDIYQQRQYAQFAGWNALSKALMTDDDPTNDMSPYGLQRLFEYQHRRRPQELPDYTIDAGLGGPVPIIGKRLGNLRFFVSYNNLREMYLIPLSRNSYGEENLLVRLTSQLAPATKLSLSGSYSRVLNVAFNGSDHAYMRTPDEVSAAMGFQANYDTPYFTDGWFSTSSETHRSIAAQVETMVSSTVFYDIRLEHVRGAYNTGPISERDTSRTYELIPGYYVDQSPFGFSSVPTSGVGDNALLFGGHGSTARDESHVSSTALKANFTAQLNFHNQLKTGLEFVYNDLNMDYGIWQDLFPDQNRVSITHYKPLRGAMYVVDKIEYEGFIASIGLRGDYSNANTSWPNVDPFDPAYYSENYDSTKTFTMQRIKPEFRLSPRLAISHPITENSKLFFNYGHFQQLPTYESMFRLDRNVATQEVRNIGNPGLKPASTIAYELGFDYIAFDDYLLQLSGFYRDISDEVVTIQYLTRQWKYSKLVNDGYRDVRGFEVTLRKMSGAWWNGQANFTYQVSTWGNSAPAGFTMQRRINGRGIE